MLNSRKAPSTTNNTLPAVAETHIDRRQMPRCVPSRPALGTIFPGLQHISKPNSLGLRYGHVYLPCKYCARSPEPSTIGEAMAAWAGSSAQITTVMEDASGRSARAPGTLIVGSFHN